MYLRDGRRERTALRQSVPKQTPTLPMEPHPFESYLNHPFTRHVLLKLTSGPNGRIPMENIFYSYRNPDAATLHKIKYLPFHKALDYFVDRTRLPRERAIQKLFHHQPTVRILVNTARSIAVRGLVAPQRFVAPLLVVWNITNAQVWDQPLESAFSNRDDRGDHCGVCDYRSFCGRCRARADGYTGDMLAGDPGCICNRHMWDEITNLQQNGQEMLHSLAASSAEVENRDGRIW